MSIEKIQIFKEFQEKDLEQIARITHIRTYPKGETIFVEGQMTDGIHMIKSGLVKVSKFHKDGSEKVLSILAEGEIIGEMSLFGFDFRSATVEALEQTTMLVIQKRDFQLLIKEYPELAVKIIEILSNRLRNASHQVVEEALRAREARFRHLAENASDVFYCLRVLPEVKFEYVSPMISKLTGYLPEELALQHKLVGTLIHKDDKAIVDSILNGTFDYNGLAVMRWLHKNGNVIWTEHRIAPVYDDGSLVAVEGVSRDITERKQLEEQLMYLSLHDPLTGLNNRASFEDHMRRFESIGSLSAGIIVCDVDCLKIVNDTMGHDAGDRLLVVAARVIGESFRKDDIVARIGGDEFAVLLSGTNKSALKNYCERIRQAVVKYNSTNPEISLSISIGYAIGTEKHKNIRELLKEADNNMYREKLSKRQGAQHLELYSAPPRNPLKALDDLVDTAKEDEVYVMVKLAERVGPLLKKEFPAPEKLEEYFRKNHRQILNLIYRDS